MIRTDFRLDVRIYNNQKIFQRSQTQPLIAFRAVFWYSKAMAFPKDILLIDFETTGYDPIESDPIQIGAVLLDKETLEEKDSFTSFIYSDLSKLPLDLIQKWHIPDSQIKPAPKQAEVMGQMLNKFGTDVILSSWVQNLDKVMLNKLLLSAGKDVNIFDYHILDLWPIAYIYLLKKGYNGRLDSDSMFTEFGIPLRGEGHDALADCRIEAEILRKIYFE